MRTWTEAVYYSLYLLSCSANESAGQRHMYVHTNRPNYWQWQHRQLINRPCVSKQPLNRPFRPLICSPAGDVIDAQFGRRAKDRTTMAGVFAYILTPFLYIVICMFTMYTHSTLSSVISSQSLHTLSHMYIQGRANCADNRMTNSLAGGPPQTICIWDRWNYCRSTR